MNENDVLELLEACDELNFSELIDDLQYFLINEKKVWIQQNLIYVHKTSSKHQLFSLLQNYCEKVICENPEEFLKLFTISTRVLSNVSWMVDVLSA